MPRLEENKRNEIDANLLARRPAKREKRERATYHYLVVDRLHRLGHLDYGHAQVAANPEGNEEPDGGENGNLVSF